jgi:hypothetical protein
MYEDFASLAVLMGDEAFEEMIAEYLEAYPPDSFTLRDLGERLAEMLASDPKFASDPLLAELARLEWCFVEAFDAADAPPFDAASLASATEDDWPRARIALHPSVQRIALRFASQDYRAVARKFRSGEIAEKPARPEAHAVPLIVYRGAEKLHYLDIEPAAFALLESLAAGTPLEQACDAAAQAAGVTDASALAPHVGSWFAHWTSLGWVSSVQF